MLTADKLDALTDSISAIYEEYQQSVINDISRRLGKLKFDSAAWQMQRLTESGLTYQNALKELAKVTNKSEKELRRIFEKAGVTAMEFDDSIYKAAGLDPLPLNLSPAMARVLSAGLAKTKNAMRNLTLTTALSAQQSFISAADLAYMQVANGAMSYDQAIRSAVKKLAADGIEVINYKSGRRDQLDVAMRRTVLTGVSQTTGQMQTTRAAEMGADLVQVSAHIGARPSHAAWQGKVFSLSGDRPKYPNLAASTGYGTVGGLMGANCRHSFYPFFEGISENAYKAAELKSYANETVTYNGQKMSVYEATQTQRGIERDIRKWKREAGGLQAAGKDAAPELAKVKEYQSKMRDFISQMNSQGKPYKWHRQGIREQVDLAKAKAVESAPVVVQANTTTSKSKNLSPVSKALDVSALQNEKIKEQVELALDAIDSVHDDGKLPNIPVLAKNSKSYNGQFVTIGDNPVRIDISTFGDHPALTAIHEIGHFIDAGASDVVWSSKHGMNKSVIDAVKESEWFKGFWKRYADNSIKTLDNGDKIRIISKKYAKYLLQDEEIFARAYAQYITEKSGNTKLFEQLQKIQGLQFSPHWSSEDFQPIKDEFDKLFMEKQWIK